MPTTPVFVRKKLSKKPSQKQDYSWEGASCNRTVKDSRHVDAREVLGSFEPADVGVRVREQVQLDRGVAGALMRRCIDRGSCGRSQ